MTIFPGTRARVAGLTLAVRNSVMTNLYTGTPNKFVNDRPSGWTALSVASPQVCPLQRRYAHVRK